jgi:hypothetical protein
MAHKIFCDYCDKEITGENKLPKPDDLVIYGHLVKVVNTEDNHEIYVEIKVFETENRYEDRKEKDICKNCFKELVNQL